MAIKFIKQRADFVAPNGANMDCIDWAAYQISQDLNDGTHPMFSGTTQSGIGFDIIKPFTLRRVEEDGGITWLGNFALGDAILCTRDQPGSLQFVFNTPIRGAGAQVQVTDSGVVKFQAKINVFKAGYIPIAASTGWRNDGVVNNNEDDSAIFVGKLQDDMSKAANITCVELSIKVLDPPHDRYEGNYSFAINKLDLII